MFGLLDMHEQLDAKLGVLSEVLANTNSGNVLRVNIFSIRYRNKLPEVDLIFDARCYDTVGSYSP